MSSRVPSADPFGRFRNGLSSTATPTASQFSHNSEIKPPRPLVKSRRTRPRIWCSAEVRSRCSIESIRSSGYSYRSLGLWFSRQSERILRKSYSQTHRIRSVYIIKRSFDSYHTLTKLVELPGPMCSFKRNLSDVLRDARSFTAAPCSNCASTFASS